MFNIFRKGDNGVVEISDEIPLHLNESYWLLSDELLEAYRSPDSRSFTTYPRYEALQEAIASYAGVRREQVLVTAGSDAAIRLLAEQYALEGIRVLLPMPTFYGYERIFSQVGLQFVPICHTMRGRNFQFPTEEVVRQIQNGGVGAVFLCQPNNPLGSGISDADIRAVIEAARKRQIPVIVDEAYYEFSGKTLVSELRDELIILRTFSKAFGLAGARVGYCISTENVVEKLRARMLPWPVAHASVYAANAALAQAGRLKERVRLLIEQRERFASALAALPDMEVYPSCTNFVLVRTPGADAIARSLEERKIRVALGERMSQIPEVRELLTDTLRLAVPSPGHFDRVLDGLRSARNIH